MKYLASDVEKDRIKTLKTCQCLQRFYQTSFNTGLSVTLFWTLKTGIEFYLNVHEIFRRCS